MDFVTSKARRNKNYLCSATNNGDTTIKEDVKERQNHDQPQNSI